MKNQNIGKRLGVAFGFLILVLIGVGWLGLSRMSQINADLEKLVNNRWARVQLSTEAVNYSNLNNRIMMQVFLLGDRAEIDQLLARRAENSDRISELVKKLEVSAESQKEKDLLITVKAKRTAYVESYKQALGLLIDNHGDQARVAMVSKTLPKLAAYHDAWNAFVQFQGDQLDQSVTNSAANYAKARRLALFLILLAVALAVAIALFVTRSMIKYLTNLAITEKTLQGVLVDAQSSEQSYRHLADAMPQMVWTATPDGSLDYYNQQWFDYTGMTLEQTKGWGWKPVLHPDDLDQCVELWSNAVRTGEKYEVKYRFKRLSDDVYRWHLGRASAVRDDEGQIIKWYGTCTDIDDQQRVEDELLVAREELEDRIKDRTTELATANAGLMLEIVERKRAEEALREERIFLRTLIDNIPDLVYAKDMACRKVIANLAEVRILGMKSEAEVLGKDDFALYPRGDCRRILR